VKILPVIVVPILALFATGCLGPGKWRSEIPDPAPLEFVFRDTTLSSREIEGTKQRIPEIPVRKKFRFCCAFGTGLGVKFGQLPLPFVKVGRMVNLSELGPHRYDGATAAIDDRRKNAFPKGEFNGLMYACHGGYIDTAHVREQVDWVAYFISQLDRHLETGAEVELPYEGGHRRLILEPVPPALIDRHGRDAVIVAVAQWLAYQGSVWHEMAQWWGWSLVTFYPEQLSGFSPEDPFSNAIGVKLLTGADVEKILSSEKEYNQSVDQLIRAALADLRPVSNPVGERAVHAVDKIWWDSDARLPEKAVVRRRYLDTDTELEAWLLPDKLADAALRADLAEECGKHPKPAVIRIPESLDGRHFSEFATLEITVTGPVGKQKVFDQIGHTITQADFPELTEHILEENREEFGPRAHLPD